MGSMSVIGWLHQPSANSNDFPKNERLGRILGNGREPALAVVVFRAAGLGADILNGGAPGLLGELA
jgi:hypothetical protein